MKNCLTTPFFLIMSSQRTAAGLKDELAFETLGDSKENLIDSPTEKKEEEGSSWSGLFFGDTPTTTNKNNYDPTKFVSTGFGIDGIIGVDGEENGGTLALGIEKVEETGLKDELTLGTLGGPTGNGVGGGVGASSGMMGDEASKESETFRGVGIGSPKVGEGTMVVSG